MSALTRDEFEKLFESVADKSYWRPLQKLGDGQGYETWTQQFLQLAAQSSSIEEEMQGLYVRPFSGQTFPPASGAVNATVAVTIAHTPGRSLVLAKGTMVEEIASDHSDAGPIDIITGRRYAVPLVALTPAEISISMVATAERPGFGSNAPQIGDIKGIVQAGIGMNGTQATVSKNSNRFMLTADLNGDALLPQHVGAYVKFTAGTNANLFARAVSWIPPNIDVDNGALLLEEVYAIEAQTFTGPFIDGEYVQQGNSSAVLYRAFEQTSRLYLLIAPQSFNDVFSTGGGLLTGQTSGNTATMSTATLLEQPQLAIETATAAWKILGFESDLNVTVTNTEQPHGGRAPQLDEEGLARALPRATGELDDTYRERVARTADTVSPNAIYRAANRILVATANVTEGVTLREPGLALFPTFYADRDAADYDPLARARADFWKVVVSYEEARAFFILELPFTADGEFGLMHDDPTPAIYPNAHDAPGWPTFHDGYPLISALRRLAIWAAVNEARVGGVGFDLYEKTSGDVA